jgi:hypothetical protein
MPLPPLILKILADSSQAKAGIAENEATAVRPAPQPQEAAAAE